MQSVEIINKRTHRPRYEHLLNKSREERFNNRSSLNEKAKNYEALSDPYTSYYFANRSVKDHLKDLKKALKYEPNFTERAKINKLLTLRIREKFQDVICPKTSAYEQSLGENQLKKINEKSNGNLTIKRLDNYPPNKESNPTPFIMPENPHPKPLTTRKQTERLPRIKNQTAKLGREMEVEEAKPENSEQGDKQKPKRSAPKQNQQKIMADKLALQLHHKKHEKWITFLEQKKRILLSQKGITESPKKEPLPTEPPKQQAVPTESPKKQAFPETNPQSLPSASTAQASP